MTADIDAVLSRLRERPECRDAVEVIERLTAENERMTEMDEQRYRFTVTLQNDTARLHDENRQLTAERDRLREAANTLAAVRADAMWMARLARGSSWPGEMAHRVEVAAERVLSLLGEPPVPDEDLVAVGPAEGARAVLAYVADRRESPVPDEPASDESFEHVGHGEGMSMFIGHVSGCPACEATRRKMLDEQTERWLERVKADVKPGLKHAAPSHPTGEERTP